MKIALKKPQNEGHTTQKWKNFKINYMPFIFIKY